MADLYEVKSTAFLGLCSKSGDLILTFLYKCNPGVLCQTSVLTGHSRAQTKKSVRPLERKEISSIEL